MKTFTVTAEVTILKEIELVIEADTEDEATEKAKDILLERFGGPGVEDQVDIEIVNMDEWVVSSE